MLLKFDENNRYIGRALLYLQDKGKGKVIPLQARCGPEGE